MDGLGTALQIETATENVQLPTGQDPMVTRWGINTAVRDKFVDSEQCGFAILPYGKLFSVSKYSIPEEVHSTDDDPRFPRERRVTKTALSAERYLAEMLGGKNLQGISDPQKQDWGIRFGFHGDADGAKMAVISATLLPTLPTIHQIAANLGVVSPILSKCPGEDAVDFADRETCPTCWLSWIESECCSRYIAEVAQSGRDVEITDIVTGKLEKRRIAPTLADIMTAKAIFTDSLKRGIAASQKLWATIATEIKEGERKRADAYQNNVRKDVHAAAPEDATLAQVREFARVQSVPVVAQNDFTDEELAEIYGKRAAAKKANVDVSNGEYVNTREPAEFSVGDDVIIDGEEGVIAVSKPGGWFDINTPSGVKTVRKDKFSRGV